LNAIAAPVERSALPLDADAIRAVRTGLATIVVLAIAVLGWAANAPLAGAVIAMGQVKSDGNRRVVQHLEGGVVQAISVRDGDTVADGQVLIELASEVASTNASVLASQRDAATARAARLQAERDGATSVTFPAALAARVADPAVARAIEAERIAFAASRTQWETQRSMLIEQRRETQRQAASLRARIEAERDAATLLDVELEANRLLVAQGYVNRVALSRLERQAAESRAREADREAELSSVRQRLGELDLRRAALDTERTSRAAAELATASASEADLADRSKAAEGVAGRLLVRAPVAGVVVANKVFTVGGVVAPGQALMEIVPEGERLIVEARGDTSQVDTLHPGQPAQLRLTGAGARYAPPLAGTLEQVSADRLADERDGVPYYIVRASVDAGSVKRSGIELRPGMPVELHLRLPDRTALRYLVEPLTRRLARTMREP